MSPSFQFRFSLGMRLCRRRSGYLQGVVFIKIFWNFKAIPKNWVMTCIINSIHVVSSIRLYSSVKFIFFSCSMSILLISIHVFVSGQFSLVLGIFLLSLLSLAIVLEFVIKKKDWSSFFFVFNLV
jgi:hypothetical protein